MARIPFQAPPGIVSDDTSYAAKGAWNDANGARFYEGRPETIGGFESLSSQLLTGVCRNVMNWSALDGALQIAFGTNSNLEVYVGGGLYDITPSAGVSYSFIPVTNGGSSYVDPTFTWPASGGGHLPIATAVLDPTSGAITGIVFSDEGLYTEGEALVAPTITDTGGSGAALGTPLTTSYLPGSVDGTGGAGYGTGTYSTGEYSQPSTADYFPRTWSLSPFGAFLVANPRGGGLYLWQGDVTQPAGPIPNAPTQVTCALVNTKDQIMTFGCTPADGSAFDPLMIRWCDLNRNYTSWQPTSANNAGFVRLNGSGRIVKALMMGDFVIVWTTAGIYLGTYTGQTGALWTFEKQGEHGGLIGPNAAAIFSQTAYWLSPSGQFYWYDQGGVPTIMPCTIRKDFFDNIALVQQDKIVCSTVSKFGEIWWFYPDARDGNGSNLENSRYISTQPAPANLLSPSNPTWSRGLLARTAFCDADPSSYPIGVTVGGQAYYHEKGTSADGAAIAFSIESADQYVDDSQSLMMINGFWPDFLNQLGAVSVTFYGRLYPQAPEVMYGPFICAPGMQKVDLRFTARLMRVLFSSNSSPSSWRLGAPAFDAVANGGR